MTNGVSAVTSAWFNGSPLLVVGGRAPAFRWGTGSLQELDHPPLLAPVTKRAATVRHRRASRPTRSTARLRLATAPHRGPVFLDVPMDQLFSRADVAAPGAAGAGPRRPPDPDDLARGRRAARRRRATRCWCSAPTCGPTAPRTPRSGSPRPPASRSSPTGWAAACCPPGHPLLVTRARGEAFGAGRPRRRRRARRWTSGSATARSAARTTRPPRAVVHLADSTGPARRTRRSWPARPPATSSLVLDGRRSRRGSRAGSVVRRTTGGRPGCGTPHAPPSPTTADAAGQRRRPDPPGADLRRARAAGWPTTPWSSATAATSCRSPGSTSSRRRPAAGSTPAPTAAWAPGSATPSPPGSPGPAARSCCCSATARPASR